jgi:hypothetical protein
MVSLELRRKQEPKIEESEGYLDFLYKTSPISRGFYAKPNKANFTYPKGVEQGLEAS